jgi:Cu(I)/Ag(I) efflux system protein CusF
MKKVIATVVAMSAFAGAAVLMLSTSHAQTATAGATATATEKPALKDAAEAEIRKIDKDAKKITLKHGPIKSLDMPSMTMVFQVKDGALLDRLGQLAVGDKIMFTAEQQQGAYVVTGAEKATTK